MASARAPIKRTYGRKAASLASGTLPVAASPLAGSSGLQPAALSSRSSEPSSEYSDPLDEANPTPHPSRRLASATPPTSPEPVPAAGLPKTGTASSPTRQVCPRSSPSAVDDIPPRRKVAASTSVLVAPVASKGGSDLRSFFAKVLPKKRVRTDDELDHKLSTPVHRPGQCKTSAKRAAPKPRLEQLFLDPFETTSHATMSCTTCNMSYSRTPADILVHEKHHKKVIAGCDWIAGDAKGVLEVESDIDWAGNRGGRILMVDVAAPGLVARKIKDILLTIDTELSSTSLPDEIASESKLFVFLTTKRKVVACAVVQRIESAFRVVGSKAQVDTSSPSSSSYDFIRFGEEEGAVFCSPTPVPTLIGVHRIWTSSTFRRASLASLLLDSVASTFIYGCPISQARRREDIAFSQPTGAGMALARRWTGTPAFKVFVE